MLFLERPKVPQACVDVILTRYDKRVLHMHKARYGHELLSQLIYKQKVYEMAQDFEKLNGMNFSWIILSRFDILYADALPQLRQLDANSVYVPRCQGYGGVNDKFILCNSNTCGSYFRLYEDLCITHKVQQLPIVSPVGLTSEMIYLWQLLHEHPANISLLNKFCFARMRSKHGGHLERDDFLDLSPWSQRKLYDFNSSGYWLMKGSQFWVRATLSKQQVDFEMEKAIFLMEKLKLSVLQDNVLAFERYYTSFGKSENICAISKAEEVCESDFDQISYLMNAMMMNAFSVCAHTFSHIKNKI